MNILHRQLFRLFSFFAFKVFKLIEYQISSFSTASAIFTTIEPLWRSAFLLAISFSNFSKLRNYLPVTILKAFEKNLKVSKVLKPLAPLFILLTRFILKKYKKKFERSFDSVYWVWSGRTMTSSGKTPTSLRILGYDSPSSGWRPGYFVIQPFLRPTINPSKQRAIIFS